MEDNLNLFKNYVLPLLSENKALRLVALKSLDRVLGGITDSSQLFELKVLVEFCRDERNSHIKDLVEKIIGNTPYMPLISTEEGSENLSVFSNTKTFTSTQGTSLTLTYIYSKGLTLQESATRFPHVKFLQTSCKVSKYQLFEIPDKIIEIQEVRDHEIKLVINGIEKIVKNGEKVAKTHGFVIRARLVNEKWFFQGNFFKFLHISCTLEKNQVSPINLLVEGTHEIIFEGRVLSVQM